MIITNFNNFNQLQLLFPSLASLSMQFGAKEREHLETMPKITPK